MAVSSRFRSKKRVHTAQQCLITTLLSFDQTHIYIYALLEVSLHYGFLRIIGTVGVGLVIIHRTIAKV